MNYDITLLNIKLKRISLKDRDKKLLSYRWGLEDGINHTLQETGELFKISRERVRQIEVVTLFNMGLINKIKLPKWMGNWYKRNGFEIDKVKEILYQKAKENGTIDLDINIAETTGIKHGSLDRYRELVRIRDGYTCQWCGKKWIRGRRYDIHHIDGTPEDTHKSDTNFENQITLCHKCHRLIDGYKINL